MGGACFHALLALSRAAVTVIPVEVKPVTGLWAVNAHLERSKHLGKGLMPQKKIWVEQRNMV